MSQKSRRGWFKESYRHSLAAKGIKTGRKMYLKSKRTIYPKEPRGKVYDPVEEIVNKLFPGTEVKYGIATTPQGITIDTFKEGIQLSFYSYWDEKKVWKSVPIKRDLVRVRASEENVYAIDLDKLVSKHDELAAMKTEHEFLDKERQKRRKTKEEKLESMKKSIHLSDKHHLAEFGSFGKYKLTLPDLTEDELIKIYAAILRTED